MKDWMNPTEEDIIEWAYTPDAVAENEEWDYTLAEPRHADLLLRLAADIQCPNRDFLIHCLYLLARSEVAGYEKDLKDQEKILNVLFEKAEHIDDSKIQKWVKLSQDFLMHPEKYDINEWPDNKTWHADPAPVEITKDFVIGYLLAFYIGFFSEKQVDFLLQHLSNEGKDGEEFAQETKQILNSNLEEAKELIEQLSEAYHKFIYLNIALCKHKNNAIWINFTSPLTYQVM